MRLVISVESALACDLIVAAEDAWFGLLEVTRGLVAGSGGPVRLPRRIPEAIALEYALTGERMDAATAHRWGLVNRITSSGGALAGALERASQITVASAHWRRSTHRQASRDWSR